MRIDRFLLYMEKCVILQNIFRKNVCFSCCKSGKMCYTIYIFYMEKVVSQCVEMQWMN